MPQVFMEAEKAKKLALRIDYYQVLSLDRSAGERDVKKAYRSLCPPLTDSVLLL